MSAPAAIFSVDVPWRPVLANSAIATRSTASRRSGADMRRRGSAIATTMLVITHNGVKRLARRLRFHVGVDDQHRDRAVVQHVVAHAAEHGRADGAPAARAHDDEVVIALADALDDRRADRLLAED